jgi:hypothetical protein
MMKESTIASSRTESERAKKRYAKPSCSIIVKPNNLDRLRTRIAYVQQSEEVLGERRTHCASFSIASFLRELTVYTDKGVVDAFQNAMLLLGGL